MVLELERHTRYAALIYAAIIISLALIRTIENITL